MSDPAIEEALYDLPLYKDFAVQGLRCTRTSLYKDFAGLDVETKRLPDESTILRFRHLLEAHELAQQMLALVNEILDEQGLLLKSGSAVDATLIAAPSLTKKCSGTRNPEMQST